MSYKEDLIEQRKQLIKEMQPITKALEQGFALPTRDREKFDSIEHRIQEVDARIAGLNDEMDYSGMSSTTRTKDDETFSTYLRGNTGQPEFRGTLDGNAMSTAPGAPAAGATGYNAGFLIPQGFWSQLSVALRAYGGLSSSFKYLETPTGNPMPWAAVNPTAIVGSYLTEANQVGFTDYQFGQGMLNAYTIVSGMILASVQLITDSGIDVDAFVAERVGEALGRKLALEAVSGTGSAAMLGINTALDARGSVGTVGGAIAATGGYVTMGTAQKVPVFGNYSTPTLTELVSNTPNALTLVAMLQAVDVAYYPTAAWYMNSSQAWNLRTVTDGNGRPLLNFANGLSADDVRNPNYNNAAAVAQLFGFPVVIDNNIANLTANTTGGPIFGALEKAMVMRVVRNDARIDTSHPTANAGDAGHSASVMRLDQRYADYLQVGFLGYLRGDIRSNDLRAAVTLKGAAS